MPVITFHPLNKCREVRKGVTILAAATQSAVPIGQSCSGEGICGWCKVAVIGENSGLEEPSRLEQALRKEKAFAANERAACLARINGDVTVTTSYWAP